MKIFIKRYPRAIVEMDPGGWYWLANIITHPGEELTGANLVGMAPVWEPNTIHDVAIEAVKTHRSEPS